MFIGNTAECEVIGYMNNWIQLTQFRLLAYSSLSGIAIGIVNGKLTSVRSKDWGAV